MKRKWDPSSELPDDEQRAELVASYIDEDVLEPEMLTSSRVPTASEIADILEPWRPHKLRRIAAAHLAGSPHHFYFLRTYYGGGAADDAKLRAWLDLDDMEGAGIDPDNEWFSVLDDPDLFDFGDDWQQAYSVLPELAAPQADRRFKDIKDARDWARDQMAPEEPEDEQYENAIMLQATAGVMWLLVLDEEAFETEQLGLILRDQKGNPVKETTITANEEIGAFYISVSVQGMLPETGYWEHAAVGKKYRTRGKILRKLLPLVKEVD